ncbi:MAG: hypothetical protein WCD86_23305 [Ktedonobacteraceae bacterium]
MTRTKAARALANGKMVCLNGVWLGQIERDGSLLCARVLNDVWRVHWLRYFTEQGFPATSYLELFEQFKHKESLYCEIEAQAIAHVNTIDYWLTCGDERVQIMTIPLPPRA